MFGSSRRVAVSAILWRMHLVIYESALWSNLAPLVYTRPVFSLLSGTGPLLERQIRRLKPGRLSLWVRPAMAEFCRQQIVPRLNVPTRVNEPLEEDAAIFLDGSAMAPTLPQEQLGGAYVERSPHGHVGLTVLSSQGLSFSDVLENSPRWQELTAVGTHECRQHCASQLADLVHENEALLAGDFAEVENQMGTVPAGSYHCVNWERIRSGAGVKIAPGAVLDASNGPIVLAAGASIGANCVIEGPCYVGEESYIRPLSMIRGGVSLGRSCKFGGEVAESIVQGNSNKVHDGYLGHSYLGEWVNLGAMTTTSNLKNTYGPVSVKFGDREISTGRIFMGAVVGDYTKMAIGTRLMSGSYVGVSSMIATSRHAPRYVPSFRFLTDEKEEGYEFHKAVEVAGRVFARRKRQWSNADESLLLYARETASCLEPTEVG